MQTLVLNSFFEPLQLVHWHRAISLVFLAKAEVIDEYESVARSVSMAIRLPRVIRLLSFKRALNSMVQTGWNKRNLFIRDKGTCQYCRKLLSLATATVDHILPRSRGGQLTWENTAIACASCNVKKGSRTPEEAGLRLVSAPRAPSFSTIAMAECGDFIERSGLAAILGVDAKALSFKGKGNAET